MKKFLPAVLFIATLASLRAQDASWVHDTYVNGDFKLAQGTQLANVFVAPEDFKVVQSAGQLFTEDVQRVTGHQPALVTAAAKLTGPAVIVGTLGKSPLIDQLAAAGKFDAKQIQGQWESYLITTVANPLPGVDSALVIAGSDRRGTAYGVFEVSRAIGVSPWYWWADVTPDHHDNLFIAAGTQKFGPPSVKYRGIFINDEDWGMNPWASKTFEPEDNGLGQKFAPLVHPPPSAGEATAEAKINTIGPKTYAKIFELLLRLKANTLWPAMHEVSAPFNFVPGNAQMADDYGIVMGSSHAEPMLRDNVNEWPHDDQPAYDFVTNPEGVTKYWEERVQSNGKFESIYTIGMRGIHDSAIQLPRGTNAVQALEDIFSVQRGLFAKYVNPDPAKVPQIFCPYKEVLALFLSNLVVPPDVTVVFPDDNFGYVRYLPTPEQVAARPGGFGIYYHISYLGAPYSYVWLNTTPPALIWEEMSKAYDHGIRNLWILNVGDLKPGEVGIDFFMQMAWNEKKWNLQTLPDYLKQWAALQFGSAHADQIAALMEQYYHLGYQRKPEELDWSLRGDPERLSDFAKMDYGDKAANIPDETRTRIVEYAKLGQVADAIGKTLPPDKQAAFFELVDYPIDGSDYGNQRFFYNELTEYSMGQGIAVIANGANATLAQPADELTSLTDYYNNDLENGKWKLMMPDDLLQRDRSYRVPLLRPPTGLADFQPAVTPGIGVLIEGRDEQLQVGETASLPLMDPYTADNGKRFITVYDKGGVRAPWTAKASADWIKLSETSDAANSTTPTADAVWVTIDWAKAPTGADVSGNVVVSDGKNTFTVKVPVYNPAEVRPAQLAGYFVESDHVVSMEAQHYSAKVDKPGAAWEAIPGLGRTGDAVGVFPTTAPSVELANVVADAPAMEYKFYMFSTGNVTIHYNLIPTQPIKYGSGLRFAVAIDNGPPQLVDITAGTGAESGTSTAWQRNVMDNTTTATTSAAITTAGAHTLKIYMIDPGVLLEKIVIDAGGLRPSYLGPPETFVAAAK